MSELEDRHAADAFKMGYRDGSYDTLHDVMRVLDGLLPGSDPEFQAAYRRIRGLYDRETELRGGRS